MKIKDIVSESYSWESKQRSNAADSLRSDLYSGRAAEKLCSG